MLHFVHFPIIFQLVYLMFIWNLWYSIDDNFYFLFLVHTELFEMARFFAATVSFLWMTCVISKNSSDTARIVMNLLFFACSQDNVINSIGNYIYRLQLKV